MRGLIDRSIDRLVDWSDTIDHRATERGEWRHGEWRHDMTQTDGRLRHARPVAAAAASPNDFIDRGTRPPSAFGIISVWNPEQTYTKCWRGQRIWSGRNSTGNYRERGKGWSIPAIQQMAALGSTYIRKHRRIISRVEPPTTDQSWRE